MRRTAGSSSTARMTGNLRAPGLEFSSEFVHGLILGLPSVSERTHRFLRHSSFLNGKGRLLITVWAMARIWVKPIPFALVLEKKHQARASSAVRLDSGTDARLCKGETCARP